MKPRAFSLALTVIGLFCLVDRAAAGTITVTNTNDTGTGSLRQAIADAQPGDAVAFNIPTADTGYNTATHAWTITLTSASLTIAKDVAIDGGGQKIIITISKSNTGVFTVSSGTVTIARLTITGGTAHDGGNIANNGNLTLSACTITKGFAVDGSGILNTGTLTATNCTITDNHGAGSGGGIANLGIATIRSCTITGNSASSRGGGVRNTGSSCHVQNTVIAKNTITNFGPDVSGAFTDDGYNFIGNGADSTGFTQASTLVNSGLDPKLGLLADNGGPTKTIMPGDGPLIDTGSSAGLTTDQRGFSRPVDQPGFSNFGDGADIGAVERGSVQTPPNFVVTTTDEHSTGVCEVLNCSLWDAATAADNNTNNNSVITFANGVTGTIFVTIQPVGMFLTRPVQLIGPGARQLVLNGGAVSRIFNVTGQGVKISGLALTGGLRQGTAGGFTGGGAIVNTGDLTLTDCELDGNTAIANSQFAPNGGAIYNDSNAKLTLTRCTLYFNSAAILGGAIHNDGTLTATNSTFHANSAEGGGAVNNFGTASFLNCTVTANKAVSGTAGDEGGGIRSYGTCTLANTIVAGNTVDLGTTIDLDGSFTSLDYNLLGSTTHATIGLAAHDKAGSDSSPLNAKFAGYGSNGGALDTDALAADSPARDAGNPNNSPSTDERGFARFGPPDIGAFEFHPAPIVTTGAATNITTNSATLNATVNPNGLSTTIQFTTDFGFSVSQDVGSGTSNVAISANVSGLSPNTAYHFNVTATSSAGTTQGTQQTFTTSSPTPTPTPTATPPTTLANVSTRLPVLTGDNALIGGFIVIGTQPKKVIIRALGPSVPVPGALADPTLELYSGSTLLESNDNWVDSPNKQAIIDSTIPPTNDKESAIVRTLPANGAGYTAIVRGANNGTGIGVVEAYDLDRSVDSKLANISTRGLVQTGDNVLIAGTIILGSQSQKVIIRAIGPSLAIAGKLEDPTLELRDSQGTLLEANDNWVDSPNKQAIIDSTIPPTNDKESAIVRTLPANGASYTAIVRGMNDTTGIAVVEIYALN